MAGRYILEPKHASNAVMALFMVVYYVPVFLRMWAASAHTIVELRYSHDPSPKLTWLKERGEKVVWAVVGTFLTLAVQWLWKHFTHQ